MKNEYSVFQCWYMRKDRRRGMLTILATDHESARCEAQALINQEFRPDSEIYDGKSTTFMSTVVTHVYRIGTVNFTDVFMKEYCNEE